MKLFGIEFKDTNEPLPLESIEGIHPDLGNKRKAVMKDIAEVLKAIREDFPVASETGDAPNGPAATSKNGGARR